MRREQALTLRSTKSVGACPRMYKLRRASTKAKGITMSRMANRSDLS
ncbi:hypothetical protein [Metabacillus malikii]|nr:hypothetical protein [Metabacillus malikii]